MVAVWLHTNSVHTNLPTLQAIARLLREEPLQRSVTAGTMEYTVTTPLATFITVAAGVGKTTRPQCVPEHQSVPREGCDMLTMLTLLPIICIYFCSVQCITDI